MNKSYSIRLSLVAAVGLSAVGLVLGLLLLIAPPVQAQSSSPVYPEIAAQPSPERLGAVRAADTPTTLTSPDDYPACAFYVSDEPESDDAHVCSFDSRCRSIQRAIEAAADPGAVICVSGGSYAWSELQNRGNEGLIDVEESLIILGGWNYGFDNRDPSLYPSILDAERQDRVLFVDGNFTVTIDGFEIVSGYRSSTGGAGIYVENTQITIANCLIANNVASDNIASVDGAGIYFSFASGSRILSSTVQDNLSNDQGGGIYSRFGDDLILQNLTLFNNVAQIGGGLYLNGDSPGLDHVVVDSNVAGSSYGGFYVNGLTATLSYVTVTNNTVITGGSIGTGGGYVLGGHVSLSHVLVHNNQNTNPSGDYGGLRVGGSYANLSHIVVSDNQTGDDYGGLYVEGNGARLSHITVTHNVAYGQAFAQGAAGLYVHNGPATLTHVLVENNVGLGTDDDANAGGLYMQGSGNALLQNITVISNSSAYDYAGLRVSGDGVILDNITVYGNTAQNNHAGLYVDGDGVTLDQVTIYSNTAQNEYGGLYVDGDDNVLSDLNVLNNAAGVAHAGVYVIGRRALLDRFEVQHNRVLTTVDCLGGGIYLDSEDGILQNSLVSDNRGCYGGGVYLHDGPYTLTYNLILDNYASVRGGGLYLETQGLVKNCYIAGNRADTGGGVYMAGGFDTYYVVANNFIVDNRADLAGGGVYATRNGFLTNNTFAGNHEQAVFYDASSTFNLSVTNNIIVSHTIGLESGGDGYIINDYTLFHDNVENYSGTVQNGFHNVGGAPAFYDPGQGDYHITQDSAAIEMGRTVPWLTDDYDGEPRPNGSDYDIGADEYWPCFPVTAVTITGPTMCEVGTPYTFTATVTPPTATLPIIYTWVPTPAAGQGIRTVTYTWSIPGEHTITVTAENCPAGMPPGYGGLVSDTHTIIVAMPAYYHTISPTLKNDTCTSVYTLTNQGAFTATMVHEFYDQVGTVVYTFDDQLGSGQSRTYDLADIPELLEGYSGYVIVSADQPFTYTLDSCPPVVPPCTPLTDVTITGLHSGTTGTAYTFTATIAPPTATLPVTYTWTPEPQSGQRTGEAVYTWATTGTKTITVTAENCGGPVSNTHVITIIANRPPVADAGPPQTAPAGTLVTLDGSGSSDPDGDPLAYLWAQTGGTSVSFTPSLSVTTFTAPATEGVLTFSLTVTDPHGLSDSDITTVTVAVTITNQAPVAAAGPSQTVPAGTLVILDGSASSDPDGDPLTYGWVQTGGDPVNFTPNLSLTTFTASASEEVLSFTLTVTDPFGLSDSDTTAVTVTVTITNRPPVADAGPPQTAPAGTLVILDGSASSDPDGDPLTYGWVQTGGDPMSFTSNLSLTAFTAPATEGVLTFTLTVTDPHGLSDSDTTTVTVTVTITNRPPVADAGPPQTAPAGTLVTLDGSGSSDPDGDPLTYLWAQTGGAPVSFTPGLSLTAFIAPATEGVLSFTLTVTDPFGLSDSDTTAVTVTVTITNRPPVADAGPPQTAPAGTLVTLDGSGSSDPDGDPLTYLWAQTGGAPVSFTPGLSLTAFIAPATEGVLTFTLTVTDPHGLGDSDTTAVTVTVTQHRIYLPVVLRGLGQ